MYPLCETVGTSALQEQANSLRSTEPHEAVAAPRRIQFRGKSLLDVANDDYSDLLTLQEAKQLTRLLINHYLGGQPLHTRQFIKDLREL